MTVTRANQTRAARHLNNTPHYGDGNSLLADDTPSNATSEVYEAGNDTERTLKKPYTFPGCIDKWGGLGSAIALRQFPPIKEPTCDANKASEVLYNIFSNSSGNTYDKFCAALTLNNIHGLPVQTDLTWTFDASRNKVPNPVQS